MDNERYAIETAPKGYALAFNGEPIKKSCGTCNHHEHEQEYQYHWYHCHKDERMENLKSFPFANGCKHFDLHWTYSVDWDEEAKKSDTEREICEHLSHGKCFKSCGPCDSAVAIENDYSKCSKSPVSA